MQKYLEKKYASYRKRFSAATDKQGLLAVWREAWKQGDIAGAFWAALTHPLMDEDISYEIYGQVHMLSHQMGSLQRADLAKLHRLQQRELALLDQLKELWQTAQARHQHVLDLQHEIHNLRLALQAKAAESTDSAEIKQLHTQLQQARQENALLRQRFDNINAQNLERQARIESLENQLQLLQKENVALEKHLQATLTPTTCEDCEMGNSPPFPASAGQRILYVGGRDKMKPHFRELVEKHYGGEFVHHDGGLHGKEHCLKGVLCQADLVFCPIDCISHNTCHAIKQHCKKHNKPMVMLRSESLSAFARGLQASFVDFPQSN
jgi:hypothetical protein